MRIGDPLKMDHWYFGALDATQARRMVIWATEFNLDGQRVPATLLADFLKKLDAARLDALAFRMNDLPRLDGRARQHLVESFQGDDEDFVTDHSSDLQSFPRLAGIAPDGEISIEAFARAMLLIEIAIILDDEGAMVIFSYSIDPEHSDNVMDVCFNEKGEHTETVRNVT
ncbi:MAG: DUF2004 domain-containing protein [Alphaproteobacteria bacterium]|nr:DUF2004 domain-containing protein [Alphaproteobacteria bacterium]